MNSEQAAHLVDKWAKEWRQYLDGMLHKYPRQALIDLLVAVSVDNDASEDFEGRTAAFDVKAISAKVRADEIAKREAAAAGIITIDRVMTEDIIRTLERHDTGDRVAVAGVAAVTADPGRPLSHDEVEAQMAAGKGKATSDALQVLMEVHAGRVLQLTPRQVERFTAAGLLAGVAYEVVQPMPLATEEPEPPTLPPPRKVGRPAKRR